jgi:hypothetical protein
LDVLGHSVGLLRCVSKQNTCRIARQWHRLRKHGALIMEFESLDKLLPTFSLVVNDQPLFSGVNLRKAAFSPF